MGSKACADAETHDRFKQPLKFATCSSRVSIHSPFRLTRTHALAES